MGGFDHCFLRTPKATSAAMTTRMITPPPMSSGIFCDIGELSAAASFAASFAASLGCAWPVLGSELPSRDLIGVNTGPGVISSPSRATASRKRCG